jgi:hypothetical protein
MAEKGGECGKERREKMAESEEQLVSNVHAAN